MKGGGVSMEQLFHSPDAGQDALPAEEKERGKKRSLWSDSVV